MIGRLRGKLILKRAPQLLVDVNGVGYELEAPMSTFYALPEIGAEVLLHTHLVVREDAHLLFGFASEAERGFFRNLIKINGVGAKMGLAILSGMSFDAFARCIQENDVASLVRLPGVGKKTAERLIVEMRDKLDGKSEISLPRPADAAPKADDPLADAVSALVALGYKPNEASRMVRGVSRDGLGSEELIRQALKAAAG
ncbi:ATP-dependent DNA helicase RuvA [Candidatus Tenderia electrophaga]|jgi:Holliday junction DNA helicase RuvA|uniref:Holliday junction branch migration complex subunit RuvA n=1 Tax=Candidatus Tenderia electrophaga TaxID=1748243 RepID=A0A0S2TFV9_9GAMM|nr:ATP-dependent DNA helicase RuvA [Candidatus Tenderia electrophaga]